MVQGRCAHGVRSEAIGRGWEESEERGEMESTVGDSCDDGWKFEDELHMSDSEPLGHGHGRRTRSGESAGRRPGGQ